MFSRVTSKTLVSPGVCAASRKASTSAANACCSGVKSKSIVRHTVHLTVCQIKTRPTAAYRGRVADGAWRFSVLGPVRGWGPDGELDLGSPQQRELLALLVLRPGRAATAEELIDALWGEDAPKGALSTIRTYASRLRRVLGGSGAAAALSASAS
ncbi:MAG: winged helix-turn-helix domain-containing protein, partial [Catenulispora sp.]|nr:winged helix-turn-helix domain-containing protein [Catenulispora sp.]